MRVKYGEQKKKTKSKNTIFLIGVLIVVAYCIVRIAVLQMTVHDKKAQITLLENQITEFQQLNDDLKNKIDNNDLYLDQQAREKGYVDPGADVFQETP